MGESTGRADGDASDAADQDPPATPQNCGETLCVVCGDTLTVRPPIHAESEVCRPCERLALILVKSPVRARERLKFAISALPAFAALLPALVLAAPFAAIWGVIILYVAAYEFATTTMLKLRQVTSYDRRALGEAARVEDRSTSTHR